MRASFSIMNLPASAACQLVPQATILTWRNSLNCFGEISISSRKMRPVSCPTRPRVVSRTARGGAHCGFKIAAEVLFHQVRNDFGVGLGNELVSLILKLLFEREVVLDDAVVHDHDLSGTIAMGMGVFFGWAAMRRPARVADAVTAIERAQANGVFEVPQLAGSPAHGQPAVFSHHRQPSRIVSAIFQTLEPIQNDGHR